MHLFVAKANECICLLQKQRSAYVSCKSKGVHPFEGKGVHPIERKKVHLSLRKGVHQFVVKGLRPYVGKVLNPYIGKGVHPFIGCLISYAGVAIYSSIDVIFEHVAVKINVIMFLFKTINVLSSQIDLIIPSALCKIKSLFSSKL